MKNKKTLFLLALFMSLYIVPMNLSLSYGSPSIAEETNFTIASDDWLDGWNFRKRITFLQAIDPNVDGRNYTVKLNLEYGDGTDSGYTVYLNNHAQTNFGDVRFTDNDGITELDYWMRNYTTSTNSTFWIEVKDDLVVSSGAISVSIYAYYGNDEVSTTSNGKNTFLYFDDFETDLSMWDTSNMEIQSTTILNGNSAAGMVLDSVNAYIQLDVDTLNITTIGQIAYHVSINSDNTLRGGVVIPFTNQSLSEYAGYVRAGYESGTSRFYHYDGVMQVWASSNDDINSGDWYDFEVRCDLAPWSSQMRGYHHIANTFTLNYDGEEDWKTDAGTDPTLSQIEWIRLYTQANYEAWFDDFFIRATCYDTEPTVTSTENQIIPAEWVIVGEAEIIFWVAAYTRPLEVFFVLIGLILIPVSVMFFAYCQKNDKVSMDNAFYGCILLMFGIALFIGGII